VLRLSIVFSLLASFYALIVSDNRIPITLGCPAPEASGGASCYPPGPLPKAASGLPFVPVDPRGIVKRATGLRASLLSLQRYAYPPTNGDGFPVGPPVSFTEHFGKVATPSDTSGPPRRAATFVRVMESVLSESRGVHLQRIGSSGHWFFTADLARQQVTLQVDSDGPKSTVAAIGRALVAAEKRLPARPVVPERPYVSAPSSLHAGARGTFWVLIAPTWGTRVGGPGADFDFTLNGSWDAPRTVTPDGTQACGGDNVSSQPFRRRGRWVFNWGDCYELGLVLTPRGTGLHSLAIYGYSVPITRQGELDRKREKLVGREYQWRGVVRP
jgi:hypothetical protein